MPGSGKRSPEGALDPMHHLLEDLFGRHAVRAAGLPPLAPGVDIIERADEIVVRAAVPGVRKNDIDLSVSGTLLTIRCDVSGQEQKEEGEYYRRELPSASFSRVLALPAEVDEAKARATLKEGLLELRLPKPAAARRRRIRVG